MAVFRHGGLRLYLLKLLDEQPRHGYDVISLLEDRFFGLYAPSAGTVYPRLARLEAEGLVEHDELEGRKVYRLTDAGRDELRRSESQLRDLEEELATSVRALAREVKSEVHESVRGLREELKQAARDVRRESRAHGRAYARGEGWADDRIESVIGDVTERLTERLRNGRGELATELGGLTRDVVRASTKASADAIAKAREIVAQARTDIMSALEEHRDAGS
jgi:DNA-binding PadR family transcriptional regulator